MQIRKVDGKLKSKIQLLRSVYDPVAKRCRQVLIGTFSSYIAGSRGLALIDLALAEKTCAVKDPDESTYIDIILNVLTKEEISELSAFNTELSETQKISNAQISIITGPMSIKTLSLCAAQMTDDDADRVWRAIDLLQKALKKSGHKKPGKLISQLSLV